MNGKNNTEKHLFLKIIISCKIDNMKNECMSLVFGFFLILFLPSLFLSAIELFFFFLSLFLFVYPYRVQTLEILLINFDYFSFIFLIFIWHLKKGCFGQHLSVLRYSERHHWLNVHGTDFKPHRRSFQ